MLTMDFNRQEVKELGFCLNCDTACGLALNNLAHMGGDALNIPVKRLTNQQFKLIVKEVLQLVQKLCQRIEVYTPMPQKQSHGDVDFLVIPFPNTDPKLIPQLLHSKEFKYDSHARTLNCEYKQFQVDFKLVDSDTDFDIAMFYKAYSGAGSVLGYLTHCREVSLTERGLYAVHFLTPTIKLKHLLTNSKEELLDLYGLDKNKWKEGFETKERLFRFLAECRFLDYVEFTEEDSKDPSKLMNFFRQWCRELPEGDPVRSKKGFKGNLLEFMLNQSKQKENFENLIKSEANKLQRHKQIKEKFNGKHIMDLFGVPKEQLNKIKKRFRDSFKSEEQYEQFILGHSLEEIASLFKKVTEIQ